MIPIHSNDFEKAFSDYLESGEYEELQSSFFASTRQAFLAGWLAANGEPPTPYRMYEVLPGKDACNQGEQE